MIKVNHTMDITGTNGQVLRIDIPAARVMVENIEMIKSFLSKYEYDVELNPVIEVRK